MIEYAFIEAIKGSSAQDILAEYMFDTHPRVIKKYNLDYDVQGMFDDDLNNPEKYRPPKGRFLCALQDNKVIAIGAFSQLEGHKAEIKRFYVQPKCRRQGIASTILQKIITSATEMGYATLYLESSRFMTEAHALYRKFGFNETTLYNGACSKPGYEHAIIFMEKDL